MSRMSQKHQDPDSAGQTSNPTLNPEVDRLIRTAEVQKLAAIGRNTIYTWMGQGKFPLPVSLGGSRVAWRLSDVSAWIASRPKVRTVRVKRGVKPWEQPSLDSGHS